MLLCPFGASQIPGTHPHGSPAQGHRWGLRTASFVLLSLFFPSIRNILRVFSPPFLKIGRFKLLAGSDKQGCNCFAQQAGNIFCTFGIISGIQSLFFNVSWFGISFQGEDILFPSFLFLKKNKFLLAFWIVSYFIFLSSISAKHCPKKIWFKCLSENSARQPWLVFILFFLTNFLFLFCYQ